MKNDILKTYENYSFEKLYHNYFYLNVKEIDLLEKFKLRGISQNISVLFSLEEKNIVENGVLSKKQLIVLNQLRDKTLEEINNEKHKDAVIGINKRSYFISSEIKFLEFCDIDCALIEDIEDYLFTLDERLQDIALSRWGYAHEKKTLEEIANQYGIGRQRIQQIESRINSRLVNYLRIHPRVIWQNIREKISDDMTILLPGLFGCFQSKNDFYHFIEICCQGQVEYGGLIKIANPCVDHKLLNSFFCITESPVKYDATVNHLISSFGYSHMQAIATLKVLEKSGNIKIIDNEIYPTNLPRKEAIAHALVGHKNGLPWKDIVKIVNANGYCSTKICEEKFIHSYLSNSEYVYTSGRGTYRNVIHLDMTRIDINTIMKSLFDYLRINNITSLHLNEYYYKSKLSREIEYYSLRYIIRSFGHEYGIYFKGRSSVDSISLDPEAPQVTQKDVVLNALISSKTPMTKLEIAERLLSKSLNQANYYLDQMINEGSVVRVDYSTYTTPENAFSNMDLTEISQLIKRILDESNIIVEADVLRLEINRELNLSYSKYFYSAVVGVLGEKYGWFKHNNLLSKSQFIYRSLTDIFNKNFNKQLSDEINIENIKKIVLLTDIVAERAVNKWKSDNLINNE